MSPQTQFVRELANGGTHLIGLVISVVAVVLLWNRTSHSARLRVGGTVFGVCSCFVYLSSILFHWGFHCPLRRELLALDVIAVLALIGGTATGYMMLQPQRDIPYLRLAIIWLVIGVAGVIDVWAFDLDNRKIVVADLGVGILALYLANPRRSTCCPAATRWLVSGAMCYIVGIPFLALQGFGHVVWHCMVVAGTFCHFISFYRAITCR